MHTEVSVDLVSCAPGFEFSEIHRECVCEEELVKIGIACDKDSDSIIIPPHLWIGAIQFNEGAATLGYMQCLEDYCNSDVTTANIYSGSNFQCKRELNRSGVGCGSCVPNNSAILGSNQCWECTHTSLILTLFFLVTGVLTVVGIAVLRITVTEGYLNAVLFYSNIANLFAGYFSLPVTGKGAFFLTAWISQNFGIPACFYDGMTMIAVTGLHLLYIVYLVALTVSLTLIMHCKQLPGSKEYAPSKILGTLLIICYTSLLEACIEIVSFSVVTTFEGDTLMRWHYDANVVYFSGMHVFLCLASIFIFTVYIIPFPCLVISPRITYKIRFFNKFQPLLDVFWAPFKPKYRWWLSFRLFLRWVSVIVANFVPTPYNILSVSILLALLLFVQSQIKPFRGHWQNVLDEVLVLNLILLLSGYFYFANFHSIESTSFKGIQVYGAVLIILSYLLFIAVFTHHLFL